MNHYIAVDLGASNGRVIAGNLKTFEVMNRFETRNVRVGGHVYWDVLNIYDEIQTGLKAAFAKFGDSIESIGIDTWGVDHGWLDDGGALLCNPFHYRDSRTDGMMEKVFAMISRDEIYRETGVQFMQLNTIFQVAAFKEAHPELLAAARCYLSIPDLLNYWLTGVKANEYSHATTTQLFNPSSGDWAWPVIDALGIDRGLFGKVVPSGTVLGTLRPDVAAELGAPDGVNVVASASHDTAAAVAAVPSTDGETALYLSSGTWSLLGVETDGPIINDKSLEYNFTNEGAVGGGIRFLKNIMGMWIQQECLRLWREEGRQIDYAELANKTLASADFDAAIDPADERFLKPNAPGDTIPSRIQAYCREHAMEVPEHDGQFMTAIYRGLAKAYARYIDQIKELTGNAYDRLYVIGGGSQNEVLNAWTAESAGIEVSAGPVEATALGNILVQSLAAGEVATLAEGRSLIRTHHPLKCYDAKGKAIV